MNEGSAMAPPPTPEEPSLVPSQGPDSALSLMANYRLDGLKTRGYHLVNLTIHLLAALTLFGLVRRTLLSEPLRARFGQVAMPLAAATALLWAVHPIQTESVTYIVQRQTAMARDRGQVKGSTPRVEKPRYMIGRM